MIEKLRLLKYVAITYFATNVQVGMDGLLEILHFNDNKVSTTKNKVDFTMLNYTKFKLSILFSISKYLIELYD